MYGVSYSWEAPGASGRVSPKRALVHLGKANPRRSGRNIGPVTTHD